MPELSVVLPTCNRWGLLSRALASVLEQSDIDFEVLVVDDCSGDETPVRLAQISDPRLRVLRQEPNQGVARARNRGIAEARGEWVAFLDDDDFWAPNRLAEHLRLITDADVKWGYGAAIAVGSTGVRRVMMPAPPASLERGLLELNVVGPPSTAIVQRDLLLKVGSFDDRLSVTADWDLWVRLSRVAGAVRCTTPLVAYWDHPTAMHHEHREEMLSEFDYMAEKHRGLMRRNRRFGSWAAARKAATDERTAGHRFRAAAAYVRMGVSQRSRIDLLRGIALLGGESMFASLKDASRLETPAPEWLAHTIEPPATAGPSRGTEAGSLEAAG